ncbi:MAG: EAL domain-containing protein [Bdellovibrionales bacterium]|jgi:cyclic-di-GMP phosphodiesterase TipF (flagellum assembly factor)|nr:EAL domain-containing protein [Bdellovibrionales bacterium]
MTRSPRDLQHDPADAQGGFMHRRTWRSFLTFRNIVVALGLLTFMIVLGSVASPRVAFLVTALVALAGFVAAEMAARRRWEAAIAEEMRRMDHDYERLVREVARNRNDMADLRRTLADAGAAARRFGQQQDNHAPAAANGIEQRMIKEIAEQLSRLGAPAAQETAGRAVEDRADLPDVAGVTAENVSRVLSDEQVMAFVRHAVARDSIDLFLQPIVNLPQRKPRFFEMLSRVRIKDEIYLPADRYIAVAMQHDMVPVIDNLLLLRALQYIRDAGENAAGRAWFCNITSLTLNDPKFMGDLVEFIAQYRVLAPRLVFELGQEDLASMRADSLPVLDGLSRLGCRFSMDNVQEVSFDFAHLEARHIRFVKIDAALIVAEMHSIGGRDRVQRLKAAFDRRGIDLIVEKIESEKQLIELLDIEIDYGQGYLFGKPVREDALQPEA